MSSSLAIRKDIGVLWPNGMGPKRPARSESLLDRAPWLLLLRRIILGTNVIYVEQKAASSK